MEQKTESLISENRKRKHDSWDARVTYEEIVVRNWRKRRWRLSGSIEE